MNMDVSEKERDAIISMRNVENLRNGKGIVGKAIHIDGILVVTRYTDGHHAQYAVYDGSQMICLCVYKKGAMALVEYINKMKGEVSGKTIASPRRRCMALRHMALQIGMIQKKTCANI